jgi:hypothetical protein
VGPDAVDDGGDATASPLAVLRTNLAEFQRVASGEEAHFNGLAKRVAPAPVCRVPFLAGDVHDLEGLGIVGDYLLGERPPA